MTEKHRRRPRLALEIAVALAVKLVALAVIWNVWFAHPASKRLDAPGVGAAVYSAPAANDGGRAHARP
ncbi:MAG: cytochrome oxidase putative small subunit CydP [Casimicrobiaceae bacterium]